jgi:transcriptional regulator with XRE-family HTH domain
MRLESSKTLAVKAGVSNKTILEIENGRNVPTFRTIRRLSEALNVDPAEVEEFAAAIEARGKDAA